MRLNRVRTLLVTSALLTSAGCYENFGEPVRLTPDVDTEIIPLAITSDGSGNLHCLYEAGFAGRYYLALRTSTDEGASWAKVQGLHDEAAAFVNGAWIMADVTLADYLYVQEANAGFLRSTDGGDTWTRLRAGGSGLSQNPANGNLVMRDFAPLQNKSFFYKSTDRGESWEQMAALPNIGGFQSTLDMTHTDNGTLVLLQQQLLVVQPGKGYHSWIFRSTDDGATWTPGRELQYDRPYLSFQNTGDLFMDKGVLHALVGGRNVTAYESSDQGATWSAPSVLYRAVNSIGAGGVVVMGASSLSDGVAAAWTEGFQAGTPVAGDEMDICYRVLTESVWGDKRRMNNHHRTVTDFGGLTNFGNELVALWNDDRYQSVSGPELVACSSTDDEEVSIGVRFDEGSFDLDVQRGDALEIDYLVADWVCQADSVADVWLTYRGENGIRGTLSLHEDVALSCREEIELSWAGVVSPRAPFQDYDLTVSAGDYPGNVQDRDTYTVTVAP